jgi:uncharacterized protein with HEPN domain
VSRTDAELVCDALEHLEILKQHLQLPERDQLLVGDAVNMRLSAAIEAISQTSLEFRDAYFGEVWHLMWATRNRISHGYAFVDQALIALTVEKRLPEFEAQLRAAQAELRT